MRADTRAVLRTAYCAPASGDSVFHVTHAHYLDFDDIARRQFADALRCSRCNDIAWLQRHDLRNERDELGNRKHHQIGRAPLTFYAIDARDNRDGREVAMILVRMTYWTERVEALRPRPLFVRFLQITRGDIVYGANA